MNTYLWIIATAYSRVIKIIIIFLVGIYKIGKFSLIPLNNEINKWPAIILAANRTDKVIGRIIFLVVSINTMKDESIIGVPFGTKWENILFVFFIHPYNRKIIHIGIAKVNVIIICLVAVKIYGNNPNRLLKKIRINKDWNI